MGGGGGGGLVTYRQGRGSLVSSPLPSRPGVCVPVCVVGVGGVSHTFGVNNRAILYKIQTQNYSRVTNWKI